MAGQMVTNYGYIDIPNREGYRRITAAFGEYMIEQGGIHVIHITEHGGASLEQTKLESGGRWNSNMTFRLTPENPWFRINRSFTEWANAEPEVAPPMFQGKLITTRFTCGDPRPVKMRQPKEEPKEWTPPTEAENHRNAHIVLRCELRTLQDKYKEEDPDNGVVRAVLSLLEQGIQSASRAVQRYEKMVRDGE